MKRSFFRSYRRHLSSFTLVELLVVMGIIAILAAILITAGGSAIRAAKRTKAMNTATQLQAAALAYYTEYNVYPVPGGTTTDFLIGDTAASVTTWQNLICSLCGNIHPSTGLAFTPSSSTPTNSRSIAFLSLKTSDVDASDAPLNPLPPDTTHIYFNMAMDSDYDGVLGTAPSAVTTMPNFAANPFNAAAVAGGGSSTAGVAVWVNCNTASNVTNANFYEHTF